MTNEERLAALKGLPEEGPHTSVHWPTVAKSAITLCQDYQSEVERLRALLNAAKCPDENCDGNGSTWYEGINATGDGPEQVQSQCQWCDERTVYAQTKEVPSE